MRGRMGSLGSLVDRLHFPLRGRKQQAYLQLLPRHIGSLLLFRVTTRPDE